MTPRPSRTLPVIAAVLIAVACVALWTTLRERSSVDASTSNAPTATPLGDVTLTKTPDAPAEARADGVERTVGPTAPNGATIIGRVVDVDTDNAVAGVHVRWSRFPPHLDLDDAAARSLFERTRDIKREYDHEVFDAGDTGRLAVTGADGRFRVTHAPPGTVWIYAHHREWFTVRSPRLGVAGDETHDEILVPVRRGGWVEGRVSDSRGAGVPGVEVNLFYPISALSILSGRATGIRKVRTLTRDDGFFQLDAVQPARGLFLYTLPNDYAFDLRKGIEVIAGRGTRVDVVLSDGGVVTGRVTGPSGEPVAGALIRGTRHGHAFESLFESDVGRFDATTDASGRYRIASLPTGRYSFYAFADGYSPGQRPDVSARDGLVTSRVDFSLALGSFVAGRVVDVDGEPIAGARIRVGGGRILIPGDNAAEFSRSGRGVDTGAVNLPDALLDEMSSDQERQFRAELWKSLGFNPDDSSDAELRERPFNGSDFTFYVHRFLAETGPDGAFRVDGLPAGEALWVYAQHDRYSHRLLRGAVPGTDDLDITLGPLGGISGAIFDATTGDPIPRFRVRARNLFGFDRVDRQIDTDDGLFEIDGFNAGRYRFSIEADGYESLIDLRTEVRSGEFTRGFLLRLDPGATLTGRVVAAADGAPIEGASVGPLRNDAPQLRDLIPEITAETRTDADGAFTLRGQGAHAQRVMARHPDYVAETVELANVVPGEERPELLIELSIGGAIEGRVLGAGERPIAGLDIIAERVDKKVWRQAVSDHDGAFRFGGLAPGRYAVMRLDLDLGDGDLLAMIPRMLNSMRPEVVRVETGETAAVTLRVEEEIPGALLTGTVLDEGRPLTGAFVTLLRLDGGTPGTGGLRSSRTNPSGRYRIPGVSPGTYLARIAGPGLEIPARQPIAVPDRDEVEIDLIIPGATLTGRVVASTPPIPLAGLRVYLESRVSGVDWRQQTALTAIDGRFRLAHLPAGDFDLVVRGAEIDGVIYSDQRVPSVTVAEDARVDVGVVTLARGAAVRGRVVDAEGMPVESAALFFRVEGTGLDLAFSDTLSDRDGRFERDGLPPGPVLIQVRALGFGGSAQRVELSEGETTDVVLQLGDRASLAVRVVDEQGHPIGGATVEVRDAAGERVSDLRSPADVMAGLLHEQTSPGWVMLDGLARQNHEVRVTCDGYRETRRSVAVEDDPTSITVELVRE